MNDRWSTFTTLLLVCAVVSIGITMAHEFDAEAQTTRSNVPTLEDAIREAPHGFETTLFETRAEASKHLERSAQKAIDETFSIYLQSCAAARTQAEVDRAFQRFTTGYLRTIYGVELAVKYQSKVYDAWETSRTDRR